MIKTENLTKVYDSGTKAVDNLTFEVAEGEIFGFLGQNGAGKSTAIKILTTLARPTAGRAWINGKDILKDPFAVRRSIGYVAQESGVDYFMTGRENLALQGRMYRMDGKAIRKRISELLELFGLTAEADQLVSTFSGGMRRKLDIATALIHRPQILFLDEPTLGLDPHSRTNLWDHIRLLNRDMNVTLFLTTHYLDEADKLSHRIGILHRGGLKIVDTPDALKNSIHGDSVNFSFDREQREKAETVLKKHPLVKELLPESDHLRVYVDRGSEAIPVLMANLSEQGLTALSVTLSRPSLDDVYLKYSGVGFNDPATATVEANPWWAKWQKKGGASGKKWGNWKEGKEENSAKSGEVSPETPWPQEETRTLDRQPASEGDDSRNWEAEWKKWNPGPDSGKPKPEVSESSSWGGQNGEAPNGNGAKVEPETPGEKPWEKWQTPESEHGKKKESDHPSDPAASTEWAQSKDRWRQEKE